MVFRFNTPAATFIRGVKEGWVSEAGMKRSHKATTFARKEQHHPVADSELWHPMVGLIKNIEKAQE